MIRVTPYRPPERPETRRAKAGRLLLLPLLLAAVGAGGYLGCSQFDRLCAEVMIRHFSGHPTAKGAQTLAEMVDEESATPAQVQRILPLLLTPKVTKKEKYPVGPMPAVHVELPFEVVFPTLAADVNESVWTDGVNRYATGMNVAHRFPTHPHLVHLYPAPTEPGTHQMEIHYTYEFRARRQRIWRWNPARGIILPQRVLVDMTGPPPHTPKYECHITVPVEVAVVREVRLTTNP
jgi:hypothetical protein